MNDTESTPSTSGLPSAAAFDAAVETVRSAWQMHRWIGQGQEQEPAEQ